MENLCLPICFYCNWKIKVHVWEGELSTITPLLWWHGIMVVEPVVSCAVTCRKAFFRSYFLSCNNFVGEKVNSLMQSFKLRMRSIQILRPYQA